MEGPLPIDEEKLAAEEAKAEYEWLTRKLKDEEASMAEKEAEAEEKRRLADEGLLEYKPVQLSKKEEAERLDMKRNKQGKRTAKTGERRHKFDLEATEAAKKEKEKEKAKRKEELRREKMEKRGGGSGNDKDY